MRKLLITILLSILIVFGASMTCFAEPSKAPDIKLVEEVLGRAASEILARKNIYDGWVKGLMEDHNIKVDHMISSMKVLVVDEAIIKDKDDSVKDVFAVGAIRTIIAFGFINNRKVRYIHTTGFVYLIDKDIKVIDLASVLKTYEIIAGWGEGLDC